MTASKMQAVKKLGAKMTNYQKRKEQARQKAIDWQMWACDECLSYGELAEFGAYFTKLAKRYGLLKEFRENGIC